MKANITMGNDEFILYIRKTSECTTTNDQLGKMIWVWIHENDLEAEQVEEDKLCLWGKTADNRNAKALPITATQFEFKRSLLPGLYAYLDDLKNS